MSVVEKAKGLVTRSSETKVAIPPSIEQKIKRGRTAKGKRSAIRRLCWHFWRGEQYAYVNRKGFIAFQDTTVVAIPGEGKPGHRVRQVRNLIHPIVEGKVSTATRRTPGYDISPATTDPEDAAAAGLSRLVALAGYDRWGVRRARVKAVTNAIVSDGGFAMPYFDPNVGPFVDVRDRKTGESRKVGHGEVKILTLTRDEVMWEEGCDFDDSPWHAIERARPLDEVKALPGYMGGELKPDAGSSENPTERKGEHLVLVTEFFLRPCPAEPDGKKYTIANHRQIVPAEPYPCRDPKGQVVDEPVVHRLSYIVDPGLDDDRGLVELLIDPQRTINDCVNKIIEWKNRCLNPRMTARKGSLITRPDDTPGGVDYYVGSEKPEWETVPNIPSELFTVIGDAHEHMRLISADADVAAEADVAARTVQAVLEKAQLQWAAFLQDLAEFDSRLMRHCLYLVARHYSEPRLLKIRGLYGWEPIPAFRGSDLRGQVDVRVLPDSLEPRTRKGIREEIQFMATTFPNAIKPEQAMAALQGGLAENLTQGYRLDVARAHETVQVLKQGMGAAQQIPDRWDPLAVDPDTGEQGAMVPGWMPRRTYNIDVWRTVVGDYTKTEEFSRLPVDTQHLFDLLWAGLDQIEQERAVQQGALQAAMAEQQGLANAGKPQGPKPLPSPPKPQAA